MAASMKHPLDLFSDNRSPLTSERVQSVATPVCGLSAVEQIVSPSLVVPVISQAILEETAGP